jgi:endonuclease-3
MTGPAPEGATPSAPAAPAAPGATRTVRNRTSAKVVRKKARKPPDPAKAWAKRLERTRPGLVPWVLDRLVESYGQPVRKPVHSPTTELVLTILSQNSADINAEKAFESLRRRYPSAAPVPGGSIPGGSGEPHALINRPGWGGGGLEDAADPNWLAVETAPLDDLIEAIRPGGLAPQKAPRIQAALRSLRERNGDYSLDFLDGAPALEARDWMTAIPGIGKKTASVVLLFAFGTPLMPVDRHVERVSKRIGLIPRKATPDQAHEMFLAMLPPEKMHEAHVNLITHGRLTCHAQRPACHRCPVAARCLYLDPKAP